MSEENTEGTREDSRDQTPNAMVSIRFTDPKEDLRPEQVIYLNNLIGEIDSLVGDLSNKYSGGESGQV